MLACLVLVGLTVLAATTTIFGHGSQFSAWRVVEAMGFAGLLWFLKRYDERIDSLTFLNGFKSCGVICYSIYLTHLFPTKFLSQQLAYLGYNDDWSIAFVCIPLTLTMSIVVGYIFHVSAERPFLTGYFELARKQPRSNAIKTPDTSGETLEFRQLRRATPSNSSGKKAA